MNKNSSILLSHSSKKSPDSSKKSKKSQSFPKIKLESPNNNTIPFVKAHGKASNFDNSVPIQISTNGRRID